MKATHMQYGCFMQTDMLADTNNEIHEYENTGILLKHDYVHQMGSVHMTSKQ